MNVDLPDDIHTVELAVHEAYGVRWAKRVPASAWPALVRFGLHIASIIYSWTPRCEIRASDEWLPERGWPDMHVRPMVDTLQRVSRRPSAAMVLFDATTEDWSKLEVSPSRRSDAKRARYLDAF